MIEKMKYNRRFITAVAVAAAVTGGVACSSCSKPETGFKWQDEWNDPSEDEPSAPTETVLPVLPEKPLSALADPTAIGWQDVTSSYKAGEGVKVYSFTDKFFSRPAIAYIAVGHVRDVKLGIWSINDPALSGTTDPLKTPSEVYGATEAGVVVNGGYFYASGGKNYSASLAVSGGTILAQNINYASEDWTTMYYPTRAAFIEHTDGSYEAAWTYCTSAGETYLYQSPAGNSWKKKPLAVPSATFPSAASSLDALNAIGGGPVLLKGGEIRNTYVEELFNGDSGIGPDIYAPRTAVGISADSKLVLFVCEGREMTEGVKGLTTEEVAKVLYSLGCTEAINLDGGGSSCMLLGGKETIKVSDGSERAVGSAVFFCGRE